MKVILYMAMTVNGFIARENDETPWSDEIWKSYYKIAKKFKAIILGRRTYEIMKVNNEFDKIGDPLVVIVSSREEVLSEKHFFVKSPQEAITLLKNKGFNKALVGGGGKLNAPFMSEKLIDEIHLDVESMIFGNGIKLFENGNFDINLQLLDVKKISDNLIHLRYKVKK